MDLHEMARQAHATNTRQDGGPGSGPGSGPKQGSSALPKKKSKITIQQAANALSKQGYELGPATFNHKTQSTSYEVKKGGKTTTMTTKQIKKKVFG